MGRAVGTSVSAAGLVLGVATLMAWAFVVTLRWIDAVALFAFTAGLALSIVGYARGATTRARRLAVVGIGCNVLGFVAVMLPYAGS